MTKPDRSIAEENNFKGGSADFQRHLAKEIKAKTNINYHEHIHINNGIMSSVIRCPWIGSFISKYLAPAG